MISRLLQEVNELKRELARVKAEDQMVIESLRNRLKELEMELSELRQIAESTQEVCQSSQETLVNARLSNMAHPLNWHQQEVHSECNLETLETVRSKLRFHALFNCRGYVLKALSMATPEVGLGSLIQHKYL